MHLSEEELAVLYDFEEDCMDELTRKRLKEEKGKEEERWRKTVELRVFYGNLKILIMLMTHFRY